MAEHNITGKEGEEIAIHHLTEKGYTILEKNWRFRKLETDIIAQVSRQLVMVEVKTRTSRDFGEPESFVTKKKQRHLIQAANEYLNQKGLELEVRFDIISVVPGQNDSVRHIEDAFSTVH